MPERPVYTAARIRQAEAPLLARGTPLMARAARALAAVVARELATTGPKRVLVLAGSGDNGGDALFAAAQLAREGIAVDALPTSDRLHESAFADAVAAGVRIVGLQHAAEEAAATGYAIVVDGMVGLGGAGSGGLRGRARDAVAALLPLVNSGRTRVVAVDLPSGLDPDDGSVADAHVLPAAVTVTFGGVKAGLARAQGPSVAGRIVLVDLGLPLSEAVPAVHADVELYGHDAASR